MSDHRRHKRDHARNTKRKAVALWNAIAEYEQGGGSREAAASPHVQTLTRDLLKLAGTWTFTRVPQLLWTTVVGKLSKEIERRHTVYWWCCLEVARQLLWMMDSDYMRKDFRAHLDGLARAGKSAREIARMFGVEHTTISRARPDLFRREPGASERRRRAKLDAKNLR